MRTRREKYLFPGKDTSITCVGMEQINRCIVNKNRKRPKGDISYEDYEEYGRVKLEFFFCFLYYQVFFLM